MYNVTFTIAAVETQQCILHVELHVTVNYTKKKWCITMLPWKIYVASNNTTYVGPHVNCTMLH